MSDGELEELSEIAATPAAKTSEFDDKNINCIDCNCQFVWTSGEQEFYRDKNLINPPKRCKPCKKMKNERLAAIENAQLTGQRQRIEVSAECATCGVVTTVPFYPSQGRPVFCRACFLTKPQSTNGAGA